MFDAILDLFDRDRRDRHHPGERRRGLGGLLAMLSNDEDERDHGRRRSRRHEWDEDDDDDSDRRGRRRDSFDWDS